MTKYIGRYESFFLYVTNVTETEINDNAPSTAENKSSTTAESAVMAMAVSVADAAEKFNDRGECD